MTAPSQRPARCLNCNAPSTTPTCSDCSTRVESDGHARTRYRGQGKRGRLPWWYDDLAELACAIDAAAKARDAIAAVGERSSALTSRERNHALVEPLSQVGLGVRHLVVVLERYGAAGDVAAIANDSDTLIAEARAADVEIDAADLLEQRSAYAIRYEARKLAGECVRCGRKALSESLYCADHLVAQRAHVRYAARRRRKRERYLAALAAAEQAERERAEQVRKVKQRVKQRRTARRTADRPARRRMRG